MLKKIVISSVLSSMLGFACYEAEGMESPQEQREQQVQRLGLKMTRAQAQRRFDSDMSSILYKIDELVKAQGQAQKLFNNKIDELRHEFNDIPKNPDPQQVSDHMARFRQILGEFDHVQRTAQHWYNYITSTLYAITYNIPRFQALAQQEQQK